MLLLQFREAKDFSINELSSKLFSFLLQFIFKDIQFDFGLALSKQIVQLIEEVIIAPG